MPAQPPEHRERDEAHENFVDRSRVDAWRWYVDAGDIPLVGLRPEPGWQPSGFGGEIGSDAPITVARNLAADAADGVRQHDRGRDRVQHRRKRRALRAAIYEPRDCADDEATEDREAAAREQHRHRVRHEFTRVLQQVKQTRADQTSEEGDQARVVHEVRGLRGQEPLHFEGR